MQHEAEAVDIAVWRGRAAVRTPAPIRGSYGGHVTSSRPMTAHLPTAVPGPGPVMCCRLDNLATGGEADTSMMACEERLQQIVDNR